MVDSEASVTDHVAFTSLRLGYDPVGFAVRHTGFRVSDGDVEAVFAHNGAEMRYIAYVEFADGQVRGSHYHEHRVEHLCVLRGRLRSVFYLPGRPDDRVERELGPGDVVRVLAGCVHTYLASGRAAALEYSPSAFDHEDTIRVPPVIDRSSPHAR